MVRWVIGSILHGEPIELFGCNKGRGMYYYLFCGMMLLIGKSSPCGGSGFPLSLSEWSLTICLKPYNRKQNVLSASLNKTIPSLFLLVFADLYFYVIK